MKKIATLAIICFLTSCGNNNSNEVENKLMNDTAASQPVSVSRDVLDEMMRTLPSPIETANLITMSKSGFNKDLLIPAENAESFPDKYSQALALGGYGVDMGYINLNNKILYLVEYLESISTVSKQLKVNQFLKFSSLAKNKDNLDSLVQISTKNFSDIDEHLRSKNRGDLSVLILVGTWIEGMHMFNNISKENHTEDMKTRIGEQKVIISNIYAILDKIQNIPYYSELKNKLQPLKDAYKNVEVSYVYGDPVMKEVNGQLVIEDATKAVVKISDEDLATIDREITQLRNSLFLSYSKQTASL